MQNVFVKAETFKPEPAKKHNKVGLDTNILVDFVLNPLTQQFILSKMVRAEFVTCNICIDEAKTVLKEKYKIKEYEKELNQILKNFNITAIAVTERDIAYGLKIEKSFKQLGAHPPDIFIIACFKNNGVTDVFAIDNNFLKVAEVIGITPRKVPNLDKVNEIMFKKALKG